ncbi:MAG: SDR family oxidoreductase [Ancalomicrobiaceae bacterium]|nr:SDR family oxidoreductase [Ancalomicrobiaceae bacterium]
MQMSGNTIFLTGGGSGIGRALAEKLHALGNTVIISGRRQAVLDAVTAANPGMASIAVDIADAASIAAAAEQLIADHPNLNVVINNAGIMRNENLIRLGNQVADAEATIATNLLGPIRLTAALLPHFLTQPAATIITVSSGLAFQPLAMTPTYSATKAAIHSWSQSLRYQLKETAIQVIELAPPYVQTELMGERQANDPHALPLTDFIDEVMQILADKPDVTEVLVERVKPLRFAEASGNGEAFFTKFNDGYFAARAAEF